MQFFFNDESFKKCRFWKKATCLCRNECFYSLARTDCSSRTPAGVTVMLKRGDASLFGKVTEWWNLTKRMRHIMDLGKHMNHLKHCHAVNIKSYQRWLRFIWGQFCFSCNPSNADEGLRLFVKLNYSNLFIWKPEGQCLLSDLFRQNSRGC